MRKSAQNKRPGGEWGGRTSRFDVARVIKKFFLRIGVIETVNSR